MVERLRGRRAVARRVRWLSLHPLCEKCLGLTPPRVRVGVTPDHVVALVNGGADDESNLQTLCAECHAIKTAEDLGRGAAPGCDAEGWPTDPRHPWNVARARRS